MWWWTAEMLEITIIKNPEPVHVSPSWNEKCTALPLGSRGVAACSVHYIAPTTSEISFSWRTQREEVEDGLLWTQGARKIVHVWVAMFQRIYTKWEHFFWWKTATCCNPQDGEMGKRDKNKLPPPRCHLTNFDWSKCRFLKRMVPSVFTNFPVQSEYILI